MYYRKARVETEMNDGGAAITAARQDNGGLAKDDGCRDRTS